MKKLLALALVFAMALPAAGALAQTTDAQNPSVVAVSTRMSGNLYSDMWGANVVDVNVRNLLTGYATVAWSFTGEFGVDGAVVTDFASEDSARGDRTYAFTLADDLRYNDGTPITAEDYVFTALLQSDPAIVALGGQNTSFSHLQGHDAYATGKTGVFSGIRLLGERQFSLTVPAAMLPYFYELTYALLTPTPIAVVAPGFAVYDAGRGAYLANAGETSPAAPAASPLTAELLGTTLTAADGYLHQPKVTSGPYQLVNYDPAEATATLAINPMYKGNAEGRKPEVAAVKFVQMDSATALAAYQEGKVQMIHNIVDADVVATARELSIAGTANIGNHLDSGYAFLAFACEKKPMSDVNVRRAIAMCIDRAAFTETLYRGNALPVYAYYSYAQWMLETTQDILATFDLGFDVESARALLERAGYTYNEDGKPFEPGQGQVRCKLQNGVLTPLRLSWAKTQSKPADLLKEQLTAAFDQLGIALTIDEMSFSDMLTQYYRESGERTYDLYFLSEMFPYQFDPYYAYQTGDEWQGAYNTSGLKDDQLLRAAQTMRRVPGGDTAAYLPKWLVFQQRWTDAMPTAPIYCTVDLDVCIPTLYQFVEYARHGLDTAILYATYTKPEPTATPLVETTATPQP